MHVHMHSAHLSPAPSLKWRPRRPPPLPYVYLKLFRAIPPPFLPSTCSAWKFDALSSEQQGSSAIFGAPTQCDGKTVGDGTVNSLDIAVLMYAQFGEVSTSEHARMYRSHSLHLLPATTHPPLLRLTARIESTLRCSPLPLCLFR